MNRYITFSFIISFLLSVACVSANYDYYQTYGNDQGAQHHVLGSIIGNYTTQAAPMTGGSYTEPVAFDFDSKGAPTIILQSTDGIINLIDGADLSTITDQAQIGTLSSSPVLCDMTGDGKPEYVALASPGVNATVLYVISISNGQMTLLASKVTDLANYEGNIVCDDFHRPTGDGTNYALWVDNAKHLHTASLIGSTINEVITSPEASTTKESAATYSTASYQIVADKTFDASGQHAVFFTAGDYLIGVLSDGTTMSRNYINDVAYDEMGAPQGTPQLNFGGIDIQLLGGIHTGSSRTSEIVTPTEPYFAGPQGHHVAGIYSESTNFITGHKGLALNRLFQPFECCGALATSSMSILRTINSQDVIYWVGGGEWFAGNLSYYAASSVSNSDPPSNAHNLGVSITGDGDLIKIDDSTGQVRDYENANWENYTVMGTYPHTSSSTTPTLIDLNGDGALDVVVTGPQGNYFFLSSRVSVIRTNYPFTVALNNTDGLTSYQVINALYNNTVSSFSYAAICDLSSEALWNEQFRPTYNFTTQNVTFYASNPDFYLVPQGLRDEVNATQPQFDIYKTGNNATFENDILRLNYQLTTNNDMRVFIYAGDSLLTAEYSIQRNISSITVSSVNGDTTELIGSAPISSGYVNLDFVMNPVVTSTGQYYEVTVETNNQTIGKTTTLGYNGQSIKNVELFSNTTGIITLNSFGLFKNHNPTPNFVTFDNGQILTNLGVTTTVKSHDGAIIPGDGFSVVTDYNNQFYSKCIYTTDGTYTQRHFISPPGSYGDYDNYHDLTVTVSKTTTTGTTATGGDSAQQGLNGLLAMLGITSTAGKFLFWAVVTFVFMLVLGILSGVLLGSAAVAIGVMVFVFITSLVGGVLFEVLPIWVSFLLVILVAAIVAASWRWIFTGA